MSAISFWDVFPSLLAEDMFQFYAGHIITQRQNLLPKVYSSLESAENACLYEKTHCTGVVRSQKRYHLVSGTEVFRSSNKADALYLKTGKYLVYIFLVITQTSLVPLTLLYQTTLQQ